MAETKQNCSCCGKSKKLEDYYATSNIIYKYYGRLTICKTCLGDITDMSDVRSLMNVMRMVDRPFIMSEYEGALQKNRNQFGEYMRRLAMRQHRNKTWEDSEFDREYVEEEISNRINIDRDVLSRWRGWEDDKVHILEGYYQDMIAVYEHKTPIQKNIYKNIAVAQMQADEAISTGKTADYQKLMKVISDLMNDAKIKPLQDTGMDDGGLNTWGEWIKKIEETEPIPEALDEFKDVDGIKKYIDKWFVKHMKKVLGIESTTDSESDILEDGDL